MSICYPYVIPAAAAAAYAGGPGDIVSGASFWWGLRAYSTAKAATAPYPGIRIVKTSDGSAAQDINILTTGALDVATIAGLGYGVSVTKIYDQRGTGQDLVQATLANMPILTLSGIGSLPVITFTAASAMTMSTTAGGIGIAAPQPITMSSVAKSINNGAQQSLGAQGSVQLGYNNAGANTVFTYAGNVLNATASDGSFHALQSVFNSSSSDMNVDGTATTGDANVLTGSALSQFHLGSSNGAGAQPLGGAVTEMGFWLVAFTGTNSSNMSTNQHAYWGF